MVSDVIPDHSGSSFRMSKFREDYGVRRHPGSSSRIIIPDHHPGSRVSKIREDDVQVWNIWVLKSDVGGGRPLNIVLSVSGSEGREGRELLVVPPLNIALSVTGSANRKGREHHVVPPLKIVLSVSGSAGRGEGRGHFLVPPLNIVLSVSGSAGRGEGRGHLLVPPFRQVHGAGRSPSWDLRNRRKT